MPSLEMNILNVPTETSDGIAGIAAELEIPTDKEGIYFSDGLLREINDQMSEVPYVPEIAEEIKDKLFPTDSTGPGYVVVRGLYSGNIVPSVNPRGYLATELAPLDPERNRAYDFRTELCTRQLRMALALGSLCGTPYRLFNAKRYIIPVTAYELLDANRFGGMGANLLHKDGGFLAPTQPEDLDPTRRGPATDATALLSINTDKTGYGESWLAPENAEATVGKLTPAEQEILRQDIFSYLPAHGINDAIGLDSFPVLYDDAKGEPHFRFSGKMIDHMNRHPDALRGDYETRAGRIIQLLEKLNGILMDTVEVFPLNTGDLLISNQNLTFHGREEVYDSNRLLVQFFLKSRQHSV